MFGGHSGDFFEYTDVVLYGVKTTFFGYGFNGFLSINGHLDLNFGSRDTVVGSSYDLYVLAKELKESQKSLPVLYMACGTQDWEYVPNMEFRDYLMSLGYDVTWDEADYGHEWRFWNQQMEKALYQIIPENFVSSKADRGEIEE